MKEFPRYKLIILVKKYGERLYYNKRYCRSFLNDFCGEYKSEVFVLSTAVEENVPSELLKYKDSNKLSLQSLIVQLKERLKENYAFAEPAALWAVESWALALNIASLKKDNYLLLKTVDQLEVNEKLQKSLFFSVLIGDLSLLDDLIKLGVDLNYTDEKKRTPLIYAIISGNNQIVNKLLELGVVTNIKDETGHTALDWAIMLGESKSVELLLTAGANLQDSNKNRLNSLELAQQYQQNHIRKLLENNLD